MVVFNPVSSLPRMYTADRGCLNSSSGVPPISTPTHTALTGDFSANSFQSLNSNAGICVQLFAVSVASFLKRSPMTKTKLAPS